MMLAEAALLLLPAVISLIYGEYKTALSFLMVTVALAAVSAFPLYLFRKEEASIYAKEGLIIVGATWILWSVAGALPFVIAGEIPSYIDALFETVSGFTTTGSSVLTNVEALSHGALFWRSFTNWIGGMGVLVLVMAILPVADNSSMHLMRAEVPGPTVGKLVPKGKSTAKILYLLYFIMTVLEVVFLLFGGMPLFDSVVHSFATAGTGGFSIKNAGIAFYDSSYINWVITVFMLMFGINFNIFYFIIIGRFRDILKNGEWKVYLALFGVSTAAITVNVLDKFATVSQSIEHSAFQVASIMTTTGFATTDFNNWSEFPKMLLLFLMVIGGCAGSTSGGIKVSRFIIMAKTCKKSIKKLIHPKSVNVITANDKALDTDTAHGVANYMLIYILILMFSALLISLNNFPFETSFTAVVTCFNNIGPGLGMVGPMGNFSEFSVLSKIILGLDMLLGRLEIYPLLMIFSPSNWKNRFI